MALLVARPGEGVQSYHFNRSTPESPKLHYHFHIFGTELEVLVKPKIHLQGCDWDTLVKYLRDTLNQGEIYAEVVENTKDREFDFKTWAITSESIIQKDGEQGFELISHIGETLLDRVGEAFSSYKRLWQCLENEVDIVDSGPGYESCGTHVHVSVFGPITDRSEVQPFNYYRLLAKAVVYFERCIDSLMPLHRRQNKFCRSNRYNSELRSRSMPQIIQDIDNIEEQPQTHETADSFTKLIDLLCPSENGSGRWYRWNFTNLTNSDPRHSTIEFRQPPGSTTAHQATFWPQFALAFIHGAALYNIKGISPVTDAWSGPEIDSSQPPTMDLLCNLLVSGGKLVRGVDSGLIRNFVEGKKKLDEGLYDEEPFGPEDNAYISNIERDGKVIAKKLQARANILLEELPFAEEDATIQASS
ncbi:MAG: hypothetical protein LQ342_000224 [Letrouitia transgressa]|nr:MAG: hypothetical protein LQ342_000224 [Letrouitia transgressa]